MTYDDLVNIIRNTFTTADYRRKKISLIQKLNKEPENKQVQSISVQELNMLERDPDKLNEVALYSPQKLIGLFRLLSDIIPELSCMDLSCLNDLEANAISNGNALTGVQETSKSDIFTNTRSAYRINPDQYMLYFSAGELVDMVKCGDLIPNIGYRTTGKSYGLAYAAIYLNDSEVSYQHRAMQILNDKYFYEPISVVLMREYCSVRYDSEAQSLSWSGTMLTHCQPQIRSLIQAEIIGSAEQYQKIKSRVYPVAVYYLDKESFAELVFQAMSVSENPKLTYMLEKNQAAKILEYLFDANHGLSDKAQWLIRDNIKSSYAPFCLTYSFDRSYVPYDDGDISRYGFWIVEFLNCASQFLDADFLSFLYPELNKSEMFRSLIIMLLIIASRLIYDDVANSLYTDWQPVFQNMLIKFGADTNRILTVKSTTARFVTMNRTYDTLAKFMQECREEALRDV